MKKLFALFFVVIMIVSFIPAVIAQDEDNRTEEYETTEDGELEGDDGGPTEEGVTEEEAESVDEEAIDEETANEIELIVESGLGAKVRLLQLKKAILRSYIIGTEVVNILEEKGEDVTELEAILAEIKLLEEEADNVDSEAETAIEDYINIKRDLMDLNQEFRKIASPKLSANDRQAIMDTIKNNEELSSLDEEIKQVMRELNAERVEKALERMGLTDEDLIEKIKSGDATPEEVREALRNAYGQLGPKEKEQAKERFKEIIRNKQEIKRDIKDKTKAEHLEVRRQRALERAEKLPEEVREIAKERINQQVKKLEQIREKLAEQLKERKANLEQIKERIQERRENIKEEFEQRREELRQKAEEIRQEIKEKNQQTREQIKKIKQAEDQPRPKAISPAPKPIPTVPGGDTE